jgi:hypothetical protein
MIGERGELILLNIFVDSLLDTKVFAGHCDDYET